MQDQLGSRFSAKASSVIFSGLGNILCPTTQEDFGQSVNEKTG